MQLLEKLSIEKELETKKMLGQPHFCLLNLDNYQNETIYTLTLPEQFRRMLQDTNEKIKKSKGVKEKNRHLLHLNTLAKSLFSNHSFIFYVDDDWWKTIENYQVRPFLYATQEIHPDFLLDTIEDWYNEDAQFPFTYKSNETWEWEKKIIPDYKDRSEIFEFLPSYFLKEISKVSHTIEGINNGNPIHFTHHYSGDGEGASCTSDIVWMKTKVSDRELEKLVKLDANNNLIYLKRNEVLIPARYEIKYSLKTKPMTSDFLLKMDMSLNRLPYWDFSKEIRYGKTFKLFLQHQNSFY